MTDNTSRGRPGEYFVDDAEMTVVESVGAIVVVAPRRNAGTLIVTSFGDVTRSPRVLA